MAFVDLHRAYVAKAERKGRSRAEVDQILLWVTGWTPSELTRHLADGTTLGTFITDAPKPNPDRELVTGTVCGVRVESVTDPFMREVRIIDKLIDELARGKAMDRILRTKR